MRISDWSSDVCSSDLRTASSNSICAIHPSRGWSTRIQIAAWPPCCTLQGSPAVVWRGPPTVISRVPAWPGLETAAAYPLQLALPDREQQASRTPNTERNNVGKEKIGTKSLDQYGQ